MLQAEDRVHRIGQNAATVRIIYVLAGWSDDIVWVRPLCDFFLVTIDPLHLRDCC